jgi:hypothetical protein
MPPNHRGPNMKSDSRAIIATCNVRVQQAVMVMMYLQGV